MRRTRVLIDAIATPVVESGPDDADEAAVFVHGNPGSADDFIALVDGAGRFVRALAMDLPGFGRADKPATFAATVDDYARHLDGVLTARGIRRAHLVLHDFGGAFGLAFAAAHPDRVASVCLVNALGLPEYRWHRLARAWRTPWVGETVMASATPAVMRLLLREGNPTPIPSHHVDRMAAHFDADTRATVLRLYRATDPAVFDALEQPVRALGLPGLVVWGEADPYIRIADASRFRRLFPDARLVRIRDAGHWPFLSNPEATDPVILDWLRERVSAR